MVRIHVAIQTTLFVILLAIGFVLFCSTAGAVVSEQSDTFQQGVIYFDSGNYEKAYELFLEAFKADPGDLNINFYLGRAAFEIGNYEMALMAFERILIAQPEAIRIKLEMARTYYRLGLRENARQYFREVLATNPPPAVRRNIDIYLADIEAAEKRHFYSGQISLGVDWDDNVYVAPANEVLDTVVGDVVLEGKGAERTKDWLLNTTGILTYTYKPSDSPFAWTSTGSAYQALYRQESDLDTLFLVLNTGPEIHSDEYLFGIHGLVNYLEINWDRYLRTAGMELVFSALFGANTLLNITPKYENKKFYQIEQKDSNNINLTVESIFLLGANRIGLAAAGEAEYAQDDAYSYKQIGGLINLERKLPYDFTVFGYYEYRYKAYEDSEVLFNKKRRDNLHYAGAGLSKTLWRSADFRKNLALQISYRYTKSDSNIGLYEYDKNVASASLAYTF
ncbi:MAG: tetratricopeptide repeat protein [Desulfobacterales bacterium]|nr:MAG: tetratricopeptide repeat protein [Desulfobacterales bacterium]